MSISKAFCPAGTIIEAASIGAPTVFVPIGEVHTITKSGQKRETDDATSHDSTSGYREYIGTIKDGGEYQLDYHFIPTDPGQAHCSALFESGDTVNWKVILPGTRGLFAFSGFVQEYGNLKFPVDKKAEGTMKIKITGPVVETFGS